MALQPGELMSEVGEELMSQVPEMSQMSQVGEEFMSEVGEELTSQVPELMVSGLMSVGQR